MMRFLQRLIFLFLISWFAAAGFTAEIGAAENEAADLGAPVLSGTTANGSQIEIYSELSPLSLNRIHSWHIRLLDPMGNPLEAQMRIVGGMPEHDHGLPTSPQISSQLDNGDYLLEGMRFHMPGHWQLQIDLTINGSIESAIIDFQL